MRQELQKTYENQPSQNFSDYIEQKKEEYREPLHETGLELASSIAHITACAMLVSKDDLKETPNIFEETKFNKKHVFITNRPQHQKDILLDNLTLELTFDYKNVLISKINLFLYEHLKYKREMNKKELNSLDSPTIKVIQKYLNPRKHELRKEFTKKDLDNRKKGENEKIKSELFNLTEEEINIREVFGTYLNLSVFLSSTGMDVDTFENILNLKEKEQEQIYAKHSP